jgi:tetratricopeptide (TPR) repeat protein
VGKTALAVRWARGVADRFADGQLYVNLRGFDSGGQVLRPAAALHHFLGALGVPTDRIPADPDARAGLYRSLLAGKRVLVLLDNARDADQVRPLLPGTPTALTVVTSRNPLTGLVAAEGAHPLTVDLLCAAEARALLAYRLDPGRLAAEPAAVDAIIAACARLPLALALVAARAAIHPSFALPELAAELAGAGRLDCGSLGQVRAVFSWSYAALGGPAAHLFRHLGLHPGPDLSAAAAASLTAAPLPDTRRALAELTHAGLLVEHAPGRYAFHDLLRAYATELAASTDPGDQRAAAVDRLLDHYTHTAYAADRLLHPAREPISLALAAPAAGTAPERVADCRAALAWLGAEHQVLLAVQGLAARTGRDAAGWQLAWALDTYLDRQGHWHDERASWQVALAAADRLGDLAATAHAHRALAGVSGMLADYDQAGCQLRQALALYARIGDQVGQAHIHIHLSVVHQARGRADRALVHALRALALYAAAGDLRGQALALNTAGWDHALLGNHTQALRSCRRALALHQRTGGRDGEAATWDSLGYAHRHLGDHTRAVDCYRQALSLYRDLGDRYCEAVTLGNLGDAQDAGGRPDSARRCWTDALRILTDLDHPDAQPLRAKIRDLQLVSTAGGPSRWRDWT